MRNLASKKLNSKSRKELETLYLKHSWYVNRLAKYISSLCGADENDLKQEGFLGIARAKELYNPKIASFLTYAQYWIKMAMFSYAYRTTYIVEIPEDFHSLYSKYKKLVKENDHKTPAEVAALLGVSEDRVRRMLGSVVALKSYSPIENLDKYKTTEDIAEVSDDQSDTMLKDLRHIVTEEEYFVINHLLALETPMPKTLSWVGKILGVTKERVRQIKNAGLAKYKEHLKAMEHPDV